NLKDVAGSRPLAQTPAIGLFPDYNTLIVRACIEILHPMPHSEIMFFQQDSIAIMTKVSPRDNHISRPPRRASSATAKTCGVRNISRILIAGIADVIDKLAEQAGHVVRIKQTLCNNLPVAGISQPLPMRVTAYYTFKVGMHRTAVSLAY